MWVLRGMSECHCLDICDIFMRYKLRAITVSHFSLSVEKTKWKIYVGNVCDIYKGLWPSHIWKYLAVSMENKTKNLVSYLWKVGWLQKRRTNYIKRVIEGKGNILPKSNWSYEYFPGLDKRILDGFKCTFFFIERTWM